MNSHKACISNRSLIACALLLISFSVKLVAGNVLFPQECIYNYPQIGLNSSTSSNVTNLDQILGKEAQDQIQYMEACNDVNTLRVSSILIKLGGSNLQRLGPEPDTALNCFNISFKPSEIVENIKWYHDNEGLTALHVLTSGGQTLKNGLITQNTTDTFQFFGIEQYLLGLRGQYEGNIIRNVQPIVGGVRCMTDLGLILDEKPIKSQNDEIYNDITDQGGIEGEQMYNRDEIDKKNKDNELKKEEDKIIEEAANWIRPQTMEQKVIIQWSVVGGIMGLFIVTFCICLIVQKPHIDKIVIAQQNVNREINNVLPEIQLENQDSASNLVSRSQADTTAVLDAFQMPTENNSGNQSIIKNDKKAKIQLVKGASMDDQQVIDLEQNVKQARALNTVQKNNAVLQKQSTGQPTKSQKMHSKDYQDQDPKKLKLQLNDSSASQSDSQSQRQKGMPVLTGSAQQGAGGQELSRIMDSKMNEGDSPAHLQELIQRSILEASQPEFHTDESEVFGSNFFNKNKSPLVKLQERGQQNKDRNIQTSTLKETGAFTELSLSQDSIEDFDATQTKKITVKLVQDKRKLYNRQITKVLIQDLDIGLD